MIVRASGPRCFLWQLSLCTHEISTSRVSKQDPGKYNSWQSIMKQGNLTRLCCEVEKSRWSVISVRQKDQPSLRMGPEWLLNRSGHFNKLTEKQTSIHLSLLISMKYLSYDALSNKKQQAFLTSPQHSSETFPVFFILNLTGFLWVWYLHWFSVHSNLLYLSH